MIINEKWKQAFRAFGLTCFLLSLATFSMAQVKGSGKLETQLRSTDLFTKLVIEIPGDVEIVCQSLPRIEITTDDNLLEFIEAKVWGNEMRIKSTKHILPSHRTKIKIGTAFLDHLETALCQDHYRVTNIETTSFRLVNLTAKVILEGSVDKFSLSMESGRCYGDNFITKNTRAEIWGGGMGIAQVKNTLSGVLNQNSQFIYRGQPQQITASTKNGAKLAAYSDFPEGEFANKRWKLIEEITNAHPIQYQEERQQPVPEAVKKKQQEQPEIPRVMVTVFNNSDERVHTYIQGPSAHPFSYGAPFNPEQKRLEEYPVGTKIFLERGIWSRKLLVTIKAEDNNKVVPLFAE